jgi:hypothetical protein
MELDEYSINLLKEYGIMEEKAGFRWFGLFPDGGYLVIYPDGERHHTYHNPEDWT